MCVPAFHGYTHSHICQLQYHPNVIEEMGLEDVETLERIFSQTNDLARVTRHASAYRRMLLIEDYLKHLEDDRYHNLGTFALNNYEQALEILASDAAAVERSEREFGVTIQMLEQWSREEQEFFATLGDESDYDVRSITYVELLQDLRLLEPRLIAASNAFITYVPGKSRQQHEKEVRATQRLEAARRHAIDQYNRITFELTQLEAALDIQRR